MPELHSFILAWNIALVCPDKTMKSGEHQNNNPKQLCQPAPMLRGDGNIHETKPPALICQPEI
jgi:hypothetical protein